MPLTRVSLRHGKSAPYRKAILDGVYAAMRETFDVPEDDRFMLVTEHDESEFRLWQALSRHRAQRRSGDHPAHRREHAHGRAEEGAVRAHCRKARAKSRHPAAGCVHQSGRSREGELVVRARRGAVRLSLRNSISRRKPGPDLIGGWAPVRRRKCDHAIWTCNLSAHRLGMRGAFAPTRRGLHVSHIIARPARAALDSFSRTHAVRRARGGRADALSRHRQAGGLVVRLQVQHQVVPALPRRCQAGLHLRRHGAELQTVGAAVRVREQREQDAAGRHRMRRRYRRRSGRRDVQRGLQRHAVLRDLERPVLRRPRDLRVHQGMRLALGPRQGHAGLERGGRGHGDAGLDAVVAGRGQQEIPAQVRRQHARLRQGRRRRGEPAFLRAQAHQGRHRQGVAGAAERERRDRSGQSADRAERRSCRHPAAGGAARQEVEQPRSR